MYSSQFLMVTACGFQGLLPAAVRAQPCLFRALVGQVPVLFTPEGKEMTQSTAITFFLAKQAPTLSV